MRSQSPKFARLIISAAALAIGAFAILATSGAGRSDPLNPFGSFTDSGPITKEQREQRRQKRADLYDRLSPDYRMTVPFVSEAAIAAQQQAIQRYQGIVAQGGWPALGQRTTLHVGDSSSSIIAMRQQLVMSGDLPPGTRRNPRFDDEFLVGLARFQIRNGLRVSGFVDRRTWMALSISAAERLAQLEANLPRMRKMMKINKAPRYVLVNVPAFTLQAISRGTVELDSNVIVGKPQRATPPVSARIVEVNFYPTWSVPTSIARKDLIPAIRKDLSYFYEQHFKVMKDWKSRPLDPAEVDWASPQVVNFRFRQDPGPHNALGIVRINMPNKDSIYMHDTPLKRLFSQSSRAFSSGCVRVERVLDLVTWLLSGQGWNAGRVDAAVEADKSVNVKLNRSVPVNFVYLTAFATPNGMVQFRADIYGRDATIANDDEGQGAVVAQQRQAVTP